ncbi:uncharacterized protein IL334_005155 [Kwoniella shivajii]|uniref:Putative peptidase domain-containing protein n=1 Tax=Kwoniella shivajii TaxID=564305 RepID=A0ABZ1D455_9TREE|nr:hypothetical protein IL334_005155 [Kwoniella shivajii]
MIASTVLFTAALAGFSVASPINVARDLKAYKTDVTIHESCNTTQRRMLEKALSDTWEVATFAQEYVYTNGPEDPVFQKYFGTEKGAYSTVLGVWESFLTSNKEGVLLRCDNIDGNCGQVGWRGHWRGDNATLETVICDASYTDRFYNEYFCMNGYTVAGSPLGTHWSIDLIHRMFHVPTVTNELVGHYSEDYASALELAEHNSTYSPMDSDALQAFAALAKGGDSCIGTAPEADHSHDTATSTSAAAASSSTAASASPAATSATAAAAAAPAASSDANAGKDCHTHANGGKCIL